MTPVASTRRPRESRTRSDRHRYQRQVATLLEAVTQGVEKLERLRARGLRGRALADHEAELSTARRELAALIESRQRGQVITHKAGKARTQPLPKHRRSSSTWEPALH